MIGYTTQAKSLPRFRGRLPDAGENGAGGRGRTDDLLFTNQIDTLVRIAPITRIPHQNAENTTYSLSPRVSPRRPASVCEQTTYQTSAAPPRTALLPTPR